MLSLTECVRFELTLPFGTIGFQDQPLQPAWVTLLIPYHKKQLLAPHGLTMYYRH